MTIQHLTEYIRIVNELHKMQDKSSLAGVGYVLSFTPHYCCTIYQLCSYSYHDDVLWWVLPIVSKTVLPIYKLFQDFWHLSNKLV